MPPNFTNHSVLQTYIHKHKTTKNHYTFEQTQYFKCCVSELTNRQNMKILTIIIENINEPDQCKNYKKWLREESMC